MELWSVYQAHQTSIRPMAEPFFADEAARRAAVRSFAQHVGQGLVAFGIFDPHASALVAGDRAQAEQVGRALRDAVAAHGLGQPGPAVIERVGEANLEMLVSHALLPPCSVPGWQPVHPALHAGTCLLDMVGARRLGLLDVPFDEAVPGITVEMMLPALAILYKVEPMLDRDLFGIGAGRLLGAVSAALALDPALRGKGAVYEEARAAVVQLGKRAGLIAADVRRALAIDQTTHRRLAAQTLDDELLLCVRRRLALEDQAARFTQFLTMTGRVLPTMGPMVGPGGADFDPEAAEDEAELTEWLRRMDVPLAS